MSKKQSQIPGREHEIERLLMETFRDDPPAGLEERLETPWQAFKDKAEQPFGPAQPAFWRLVTKGALAAAAVGMVVWGILMQAGGSSNVLAKNLSLIKTTVMVKDRVNLAPSLYCRIELSQDLDREQEYLVQWLPPNLQRVDTWDREGELIRTVWVRDQVITVAERGRENIYSVDTVGKIDDPYLPAILRMIRPEELGDLLYGEWEETGRELREGCVWSTYRIASLEERRTAFDMTVDLCDYRPVEIRRDLDTATAPQGTGQISLHFHFDWDHAVPMEHMIPEKKTAPREV